MAVGGRIDEAISVELNGERSAITAFSWRGERYLVQSVDAIWTEPRRWPRGEGERTWFQVTARGLVYELYLDHQTRGWFLGFVRG